MADLINLRMARKRAKQRQDEERSNVNRLAHSQPKTERKLDAEQRAKLDRYLAAHRIDKGDSR